MMTSGASVLYTVLIAGPMLAGCGGGGGGGDDITDPPGDTSPLAPPSNVQVVAGDGLITACKVFAN